MDREPTYPTPSRTTISRRGVLRLGLGLAGAGLLNAVTGRIAEAQTTPPAPAKPVAKPVGSCVMGQRVENKTGETVVVRFQAGGAENVIEAAAGETKGTAVYTGTGDRDGGKAYAVKVERLNPADRTQVMESKDAQQECGKGYAAIIENRRAAAAVTPTPDIRPAAPAATPVAPVTPAVRPTRDPNRAIIPSFGDFVRGTADVALDTGDTLSQSPDARNAATWIIPAAVVGGAVYLWRRFWG